jgi:hypothetical protein
MMHAGGDGEESANHCAMLRHRSGLVSAMGALALGEGRTCESPSNQQRKITPFRRTA